MSAMRVPRLKGKEDFAMWWSQFQALASVKGFREALFENFKNKLPASDKVDLDPSNNGDKLLMKAKVTNNLAMSFLTLAMDSPQLLSKIEASKSQDWPGGLAYVLVAKLMRKY